MKQAFRKISRRAVKICTIILLLAGLVFILTNMDRLEVIYKDNIFFKGTTSAPSSAATSSAAPSSAAPSATPSAAPSSAAPSSAAPSSAAPSSAAPSSAAPSATPSAAPSSAAPSSAAPSSAAPSSAAPSATPSAPSNPNEFCTFKPPLSSADAEEEQLLLTSSWPETPVLPDPVLLHQTSHATRSTFTILPRRGGGEWRVGDQLEVMIKVCDFQGNNKKFGGDFFVARMYNMQLEAGVAGRVVDHLNGSYSAVFTLLWEGSAQVQVELIHPSEAITALRRLNREGPDRIIFKSLFRLGSISETTNCNICLRPNNQPQCNFTDLRTGDPWFCYKPKNLGCDTRINHMKTGYTSKLKADEKKLFQRNVNLRVLISASGPSTVNVFPQGKGQPRVDQATGKPGPSGYFYHGMWKSLGGTKVHQFNNASTISQCLKGKVVHLYGDSTIRQWFEYLTTSLPDAKVVNLNSPAQAGPFVIWDHANKIMVKYQNHGLPLRISTLPSSKESYIANELDTLVGGTNTVVVFGICAHFGTFPTELYIRRLQSIRRAVVRLLNRAPGTLVVIKTGTLINVDLSTVEGNINWFTVQADEMLKVMFKGINIQLVNAWDMVLAHKLHHGIHPPVPIIKNMINVLLSYVCPQK